MEVLEWCASVMDCLRLSPAPHAALISDCLSQVQLVGNKASAAMAGSGVGGGLYLYESYDVFNITDSQFVDNAAAATGGALQLTGCAANATTDISVSSFQVRSSRTNGVMHCDRDLRLNELFTLRSTELTRYVGDRTSQCRQRLNA